jgi:hypothetical protein
MVEEQQIYYRLQNNVCNQISLLPSQKTANDYSTLNECQSYIHEGQQTYYRFQENTCSQVLLLPSQKTVNDYSTIQECQDNVSITQTESLLIPILLIILGIIFVIVLLLIIKKKEKIKDIIPTIKK